MSEANKRVIGVDRADLTDAVWRGIAEAYVRSAYQLPDNEAVSSRRWYDTPVRDVLEDYGEFRFGSIVTPHSKLWVCGWSAVHFSFDHNAEDYELEYARESLGVTPESIQADFSERQAAWLGSLGIAREITDCPHAR